MAHTLNGLAALHRDAGNFDQAVALLERSLAIFETTFGAEHMAVARSQSLLGDIHLRRGELPRAEDLFKRALEILGAIFPADSEDLALCRRRLALLHQQQGLFALAETRGHESLDIRRRLFGDIHPRVAESLETLARGLRLQGKNEEALELAAQAFWVRQQHFEHNADALTEGDALAFAGDMRRSAQGFLDLFATAPRASCEMKRAAADILLASKGQVSDRIFERQRILMRESDPVLAEKMRTLRTVKFLLSEHYIDGPGDDLAAYRQESDSLLNWAERLEAELARAGADVVSGRAEEQVSADRIAAELPEDASLVEFYRCRSEDPIDGLKDDGLMLIAPDCTRRPSPVSARRPRIRRHGGSPCAGARACIPSAVSMKRRWPT